MFLCIVNCQKISKSDKKATRTGCDDRSIIISLAEKEWLKVYGRRIYNKRPFTVRTKNDSIRIVEGTLPEDYDGGVPYAEVDIKKCKVVKISHGK